MKKVQKVDWASHIWSVPQIAKINGSTLPAKDTWGSEEENVKEHHKEVFTYALFYNCVTNVLAFFIQNFRYYFDNISEHFLTVKWLKKLMNWNVLISRICFFLIFSNF